MDSALDMSLDDYIAIRKSSAAEPNSLDETTFKSDRRRCSNENDDDDDMYNEAINASNCEGKSVQAAITDTFGIWKGPDAKTAYIELDSKNTSNVSESEDYNKINQKGCSGDSPSNETFDLREKITGNLPHLNSQQWRLMYPNTMSRPAGMPPVVPRNTPIAEHQHNWQHNRRRQRRHNRNNNGGGSGFGSLNGGNRTGSFSNNQGSGNFTNQNRNTGYGGVGGTSGHNNGRIQRFNQRNQNNNQHIIDKNIKHVLDVLNKNFPSGAQDLTIECPNDSISLSPSTSRNFRSSQMSTPIMKGDSRTNQTADLNATFEIQNMSDTNRINNINNNNKGLKALLGVSDNLKTEMMPVLASKFLDFLQNGATQQQVIHKPIYDMKVQKEIHDLQKKHLMYKCPGGEVISSDGNGINCEIIPRTSGVSMNYRFG